VIGRKRELPPELEPAFRAFERVLEAIEPAKAAVADVLPGTRLPGRPLHDAMAEYRAGIERAGRGMAGWRRPEVEDEWQACAAGLQTAEARATALLGREEEPEGFEALLGTVQGLIEPLDPFVAAAERFRSLRRRPRRPA
jgi:formylglycine-generating enzyme required for sulfatase activity